MDYFVQLKNPASLRYIDSIAAHAIDHPGEFEPLYDLIFDRDTDVAWRAAWACQKISCKRKSWFDEKKQIQLCNHILNTNHGGIRRGCMSILINTEMPDHISVEMINFCFDSMLSPKSPISVQALSMKFLLRVCEKEPDFAAELYACLENADSSMYTPGFSSTRRNTLKVLSSKYLKNIQSK